MTPCSQFEDVVEAGLRALDGFSGPNVRILRNKVYPGAKDPKGYEIDISVKMSLTPGLTLLIIVECKEHSRPVARP